jgi:ribosome recycling factor
VPLQQLASFSVPEARMLVIAPFDKGSMAAIERSIRDANLGLNPSNDGIQIRLAFPALTEERRKEFVRMVRQKAEDGRTAVRNARRDARKDLEGLEKDGDISEDDMRRAEDDLDKLTKRHESDIDAALEAKTIELMEG